ncbi:CBO0543 family protein [Desulforamulus ruminis]|uniref:Uncharacterized protein n=2 Tax=Desulforamulus ruminis TaxID=1564 RepID=F6DPT1_DESRL|nr:hypothetical protein Desru_2542 [Desulforamulus ruminis DSM 2154]
MNTPPMIETYITIFAVVSSLIGSYFIIRLNWKRYGLLFLISGILANILCYIFVTMGFYSFPYRLFPSLSPMPFDVVLTVFPFAVLISVRYSPKSWYYKIFFYWCIVHMGMLAETLVLTQTKLINYDFKWDFWDSYTWWWIFFLLFEWIGGRIIPEHLRKPISADAFKLGNWAWILFHFIVILTIFLGGVYLGFVLK